MIPDFPRNKVIEALKELADLGFQRRVWLATGGPEVSSFEEAVCGLFNDTGLGDLLEKQRSPVFGPESDAKLREIRGLTRHASQSLYSLDPSALIEHPAMKHIRDLAGEILAGIGEATN
jgi:hypothetical protein